MKEILEKKEHPWSSCISSHKPESCTSQHWEDAYNYYYQNESAEEEVIALFEQRLLMTD